MSKDAKNVPALRFKGYSDAWEKRKLTELSKNKIGGGTPSTKVLDFWNGKLPWLQSSDINESNNYSVKPQKFISLQALKHSAAKRVPANSIAVVTRVGVGKLALIEYDYSTSQDFLSFSSLNWSALFSVNLLTLIMTQMSRESQGTSIKGVTKSELLAKKVRIPISLKEQEKLGILMKSINDLIAATQHKIDAWEQAKKALLQRLFDQSWRFKGYSDPWEKRKLGETNSYFTDGNYGESYPKESELSDKENGVPFLRGSNLRNGELIEDNANYITKEKHAELTSGHLVEDDIVLAVRGSLGALGYVKDENIDWNINSQLAVIRTDKSELSGKFLVQFLLSWRGQKELLSRNTGTALKQLPIKQLKDVPVPIVNLDEQKEIGALFSSIDNLIAATQSRFSSLELLKKALLQDLFI
ncbi:EcoKI restriction-modification system protein HsdS [Lacticaseibacillus paracasei]|uniref:restriction endonuclease subunit S n=1 Tax=Lacticaseibacillus paracasei TaxID=1597 RepID=UPI000F43A61E|nr:restriction endonuclease subunit S [Lacticaseibacillus paracasei]RND99310.1 EcoKI restriction-modification system protein HsdS [Lacticaseibacillus paracasei]RNE18440.1 EcoKI restriction-modification system protein HsdS [Lacticaseibacillus paracasei]